MQQNIPNTMDRRSVALITMGHLCIDLCQGAVPAFLPFLILERHLSYTAAAGLILATNISSSIVQPLFGRLADRRSAPWLMPAGLLVAGTGLALAGFASTYWLLVLSVGFGGLGIAAFHPEAARLISAASGKKRGTGMSIFSVGGNLGFALGPLLTTAFLLMLGLKGASFLLVPTVTLAIVLTYASKHLLPCSHVSEEIHDGTFVTPDLWGPFARLTAIILCRSMIFYGLNTFLPLYWTVVLHQSKAIGGVALTILLIAGVAGTLIGGRVADRYGRRIVVLISFSILFPVLLLFVVLSPVNIMAAYVLLVPIGLFLFAPFSVMVVMGQEYLPNHVGTASGVTLGLAVTVGGIMAPLFGKVADLYGIHTALTGLAFVPLLAMGLVLTLPPLSRLQRSVVPQKNVSITKLH